MSAALELDAITASLKGRHVLENIHSSISAGEFVGLIGPNGAGKTTLLRLAAGLSKPDTGAVRVDGVAIDTLSPRDRARKLSYLPQARPVYWGVEARAVVALGRFAYGDPLSEDARDNAAVDNALAESGAAHLADRNADALSGGELARIHMARALAGEAPLLLADEPIAALDPEHQLSVLTLLRKKALEGRTIIAVLHDLSLAARYCSRLIVLDQGRIAADGPPDAVLTPQILRDVFRVTGAVENHGAALSVRLSPLSI